MRYYLAIDIGASSGRHIVSYMENGKMITEEIYRFQNGPEMLTAYDGKQHLMWTHERLFTEILNGLKKAKEIGKIPIRWGSTRGVWTMRCLTKTIRRLAERIAIAMQERKKRFLRCMKFCLSRICTQRRASSLLPSIRCISC